jgi:hypothetical protein
MSMRWVWFRVGWPSKISYQNHSNVLQTNALLLSLLNITFGSTIQKFNPVDNLEFCSTSRVSHKLFPEPFEATIMNFGSHAKGKRTLLWDSENEFYTFHLETILWITCSKIMESFTQSWQNLLGDPKFRMNVSRERFSSHTVKKFLQKKSQVLQRRLRAW